MVRASAPGKCILFGEHAVLYGQPAVAVAIEQRCNITITDSVDDKWHLEGMIFKPEKHPHIDGLRKRLWHERQPLTINIDSAVPSGSGLGSSAALSVALAAALRAKRGRRVAADGSWHEGFSASLFQTDAYSKPDKGDAGHISPGGELLLGRAALDSDELALLGHAIEAESQGGRASPTDTATASYGGAVMISDRRERGFDWLCSRRLATPEGDRQWEVHRVKMPDNIDQARLVIGNTGVHSRTATVVADVAAQLKQNPERMLEIETIGDLSRRGASALRSGELEELGRCMSENHLLLRGLGVSCPELENLIRAAAPTSLGVKLTGAGRGGCMVALTMEPTLTCGAIELAGGRAYISEIGCEGARIDRESGN